MRILLVEDDEMIGASLHQALQQSGYAVDWARDGELAETALLTERYDAVLLDLGLPRRSGIEVLKSLRGRGDAVPVLILTARDAVPDRVRGLDAGADDYLVKPFALDELEARLRALSRRNSGRAEPLLTCGEVSLDPTTREIHYRQQQLVLTAREYALMAALLERPGAILARAQLEQRLYGWGDEVGSNAVEVYIHQLRRKLGSDLIRNIRGVGYMVPRTP